MTPGSLAQSLRLSDVAWDSDGETVVWLEGRSDRGVLVCASPGQAFRDLTTTLSVRARVGYGGGDMAVAGGTVYFWGSPDLESRVTVVEMPAPSSKRFFIRAMAVCGAEWSNITPIS